MNANLQDLTVSQVADEMNCSPKTVCRLANKGTLRGYRLEREWRFKRDDVDAFRTRQAAREPMITQKPRVRARTSGGHLPGWHDYDHGRQPS